MPRGKNKTNDEFQAELKEKCPGIHTDDKYINSSTPLIFYCDYGHQWPSTPTNILHMHSRCPCCAGQRVVVGETDLWTKRPDIASLLVNSQEGFLYTEFSHKKLKFRCPNCGCEFEQDLNHVSRRGISCPNCSDGMSFPNKFMRNILLCTGVKFEQEYNPDWIKPKRYDFYFEFNENQYIIEMDGGLGHGHDPQGSIWFDKDKSRATDEYKDNMAKIHNIEVIRINCDYNYDIVAIKIFDNIINSKLSDIFDLSKIDARDCELKAQKSIFKEVCDLFNAGFPIDKIANKLQLSIGYVKKMIKKGKCLDIITRIDFDIVRKNSGLFTAKDDPVVCIETSEKFVGPNDVLKKLGIKIYDVIDKPNRSAGKTDDGKKRHWIRMSEDDAKVFVQEYYSSK